jgi:hypothetical protein
MRAFKRERKTLTAETTGTNAMAVMAAQEALVPTAPGIEAEGSLPHQDQLRAGEVGTARFRLSERAGLQKQKNGPRGQAASQIVAQT